MHFDEPTQTKGTDASSSGPWYEGLTRYHWFVLVVAALGWLFDTMDQQLFTLARMPAITELYGKPDGMDAKAIKDAVNLNGGIATSIFMVGWAIGGLYFGILGDKIGRAKTMLITILLYSIFTGLSAFSVSIYDFMLYRFLTGLGVGGEFAVGVALVAEVMPDRARAYALGWLQALSAIGNITAASIVMILGVVEDVGVSSWRVMFIIGTFPALLAILIRARLKEPERWKQQKAAGSDSTEKELGSVRELFTDPTLRRNTIAGMVMAFAGVVGLWGIGFFSPDLVRSVFNKHFAAQNLTPEEISKKLTLWTGITSLFQNAGAFLGIHAFSYITNTRLGRKPTFAIFFMAAMIATSFTFWTLNEFWQIFVLIPIMGFCQIALFGGYAIYFPELFPTRLRSTGTSFCYNVGRLVAALGPFTLGYLSGVVFKDTGATDPSMPMRYAGVAMCSFFLIGMMALPFAPETKGKPLPE
jgi:MFS family permease